MPDFEAIKQLKLSVPTYYGSVTGRLIEEFQLPEYGHPEWHVLVHSADGLRIVLGTHDLLDCEKPDVKIERRPNGWAIFLHPTGGDPCGYVYFLDDGRSFLVPEWGCNAIEVLNDREQPAEVDLVDGPVPSLIADVPRLSAEQKLESCSRCHETKPYSGDWYAGLCPECADATEENTD